MNKKLKTHMFRDVLLDLTFVTIITDERKNVFVKIPLSRYDMFRKFINRETEKDVFAKTNICLADDDYNIHPMMLINMSNLLKDENIDLDLFYEICAKYDISKYEKANTVYSSKTDEVSKLLNETNFNNVLWTTDNECLITATPDILNVFLTKLQVIFGHKLTFENIELQVSNYHITFDLAHIIKNHIDLNSLTSKTKE